MKDLKMPTDTQDLEVEKRINSYGSSKHTMSETKNWLTIAEIANEYSISRQTIWRLVKDGFVASEKIGRRLYRVNRSDWLAYLERNRRAV